MKRKFFDYNKETRRVEILDNRILLVKEFKALTDLKRNITKEDKTGKNLTRFYKEIIFIFMYLDWESPYFKFPEEDKQKQSLIDSGLTEKDLEDFTFKAACDKYNELYNGMLELRLLKSSMIAVENIIYYLETVDVNLIDEQTGKPIYKTKDVIAEIKSAKDVISAIKEMEDSVKKGLSEESGVRGDTELGLFD